VRLWGRHVGCGVAVAYSACCAVAWASGASVHVKLLFTLPVFPVMGVALMARWAGTDPHRRQVLFKTLLAAPVAVLGVESALAYKDQVDQRRLAPVRASRVGDPNALMMLSDECDYRLRPRRDYRLFGGVVAIDSNGFRSSYDVALQKDPDRIRVILTSGSTGFGWGVPDGHDVVAYLQAMLDTEAGDDRFEVINASVPYFNTYQEMNWYHHALSKFEPDLLIVLDGYNDMINAVMDGHDWRPAWEGDVGRVPVWHMAPTKTRQRTVSDRVEAVLMKSAAYRTVYWRVDRLVRAARQARSKRTSSGPKNAGFVDRRFIDQFVEHWGVIASKTRRNGTRCILALQPIIDIGKTLTENEKPMRHMWGGYTETIRQVWPDLRRACTALRVEGVTVLDLTDVFAQFDGDAYQDKCHYTSEGNRIIASKLAAIVRRHYP